MFARAAGGWPLDHRRHAGTTHFGRTRCCPRGRISTRSPAGIPRSWIASTATSPSPTPQPSPPPASPARQSPPQGGAIDLDASGEPTGILRESAKDLVYKVIPPPTAEERRRGAELAITDALAHGVTSVQDFTTWDDFLAFEQMEKEGKLDIRISEWLPFSTPLDELKKMRAHHDINDPMLHTGMLKGFMDGSLGSRTAAMKAPFADDPAEHGPAAIQAGRLEQDVHRTREGGIPVGLSRHRRQGRCDGAGRLSRKPGIESLQPATASSMPRSSIPPTFRASSSSASSPQHAAQPPAYRHELGRRSPRSRNAPHIPTRGRRSSMPAFRWPSAPTIPSSPSRLFAGSTRR